MEWLPAGQLSGRAIGVSQVKNEVAGQTPSNTKVLESKLPLLQQVG